MESWFGAPPESTELSHSEYKSIVESRISNNAGTTPDEIIAVALIIASCTLLASLTPAFTPYSDSKLLRRMLEFSTLVFPMILCCNTVNAETTWGLALFLAAPLTLIALGSVVIPPKVDDGTKKKLSEGDKVINNKKPAASTSSGATATTVTPPNRRATFFSAYRGSLMLSTIIAILNVDFLIFPRRFIKTETFGISLMDIGVGCFVFSAALAIGGKQTQKKNNQHKSASSSSFQLNWLKSSVPLFLIGGVRFYMCWIADYHEHISEYGKHWNFFCTLGILPIIYFVVSKLQEGIFLKLLRVPVELFESTVGSPGVQAVTVGLAHQFLILADPSAPATTTNLPLSPRVVQSFGLGGTAFVLDDSKRRNFFEQNKEGLLSSFGYLCIFFAGVECGKRLLRSPSTSQTASSAAKSKFLRGVFTLAVGGCLYMLALWFNDNVQPISRRLCNLPYCLYIVSLSLFSMGFVLACEDGCRRVVIAAEGGEERLRELESSYSSIVECINHNQFFLFLGANLLTGLTNVSMRTLFVPPLGAYCILSLYMLVVCVAAVVLKDLLKLQLKFW